MGDFLHWFKKAYEVLWQWFSDFGDLLKRWWGVALGFVIAFVTFVTDSIQYAWEMIMAVFDTLIVVFGNVGGLNQSDAFAGSPWGPSLSVINAFIPLTEILTYATAYFLLLAVLLGPIAIRWLYMQIRAVFAGWI